MSKDPTEMVHCATIGQFTVLPLVSLLCYHWSVHCATIGQFIILRWDICKSQETNI